MDIKEKTLEKNLIYDGRVIKYYNDKVLCPNGNISNREYVMHNGGAAILYFNEKNEVCLVKQYRYVYDELLYEIPAGKLEINELPLEAAKREFEEEAGLFTTDFTYLGVMYPSCGYTNEKIHLFYAKNAKTTKMNLDFDESLEPIYIPYDKVKQMILDNEIKDAKTICAIYRYELFKKNNKNS